MKQLLAAEALKLRTTRASLGVLVALVAICGIGAAATVGAAGELELGSAQLSQDVVSASLFAGFLAFLLAITIVTSEWRHGTIARTFLASPRRIRVLVAKAVAGFGAGAVLAVAGLVVVSAVAVPWLAVRSSSFVVDGDVLELAGRAVVSAALWGALGIGVGAIVQSQTPALIIGLVWVLLIENLLVPVLALVDAERVADYLPGRALTALEGTSEGGLSAGVGLAVALVWIVGLCALGGLRMARRDVT